MEHLFIKHDDLDLDEMSRKSRESVLSCEWPPQPNNLLFREPKTQYLGFDHDTGPLGAIEEYLPSRGYNTEALWDGDLEMASDVFRNMDRAEKGPHAAALIQAWLYYGVLESVLHKKIKVSFLAREDVDGKVYLDSRNLNYCLNPLIFGMKSATDWSEHEWLTGWGHREFILRMNERILNTLRLVQKWVVHIVTDWHALRNVFDHSYPGFMEALDGVIPAIVRLGEAVDYVRFSLCQISTSKSVGWWQNPYSFRAARRKALQDLGWCPFQVEMMEKTLSNSTIDWLVARRFSQDPDGHDACTVQNCDRNNVDEKTYQQVHICPDGACEKIKLDAPKVKSILATDGIPVVRIEMGGNYLSLVVEARPKSQKSDFIAISHVWADGLGGDTETGLNQCQVEKVYNLIVQPQLRSDRGDIAPIWLDCLCIPNKQDKSAYIKALVGIRDVYLGASKVLVLDRLIGAASMADTLQDFYARIALSPWIQRMWTYEEAVLNGHLVFALKDGFHHATSRFEHEQPSTVDPVCQSLVNVVSSLRLKGQFRGAITAIQQAFRFRLTNVRDEEFLSVAGVLDLNTAALLDLKGESRTKKFWTELRAVPSSIPFLIGPKLALTGFRWAPKTLMYPTVNGMPRPDGQDDATCTEDGLFGKYPFIRFDKVIFGDSPHRFFIVVEKDQTRSLQESETPYVIEVTFEKDWWPSEMFSLPFDHLLAPSTDSERVPLILHLSTAKPSAFSIGKYTRGVALRKEGKQTSLLNIDAFPDAVHGIENFAYVGPVWFKRIGPQEMEHVPVLLGCIRERTAYYPALKRILDADSTQSAPSFVRGTAQYDMICIT